LHTGGINLVRSVFSVQSLFPVGDLLSCRSNKEIPEQMMCILSAMTYTTQNQINLLASVEKLGISLRDSYPIFKYKKWSIALWRTKNKTTVDKQLMPLERQAFLHT